MREQFVALYRSPWTAWWLPVAVLVAGATLSFNLYRSNRLSAEQLSQTRFDLRVSDLVGRVEQRLMDYEQMLRGARGLFEGSSDVTRRDFAAYVNNLELQRRYPGIQGLGFAIVLRPEEVLDHVAQVRREVSTPVYEIRPSQPRPLYTSIMYLEPFRDRNLRAFGYDMLTEPVRRAALERARDNNEVAISGKVYLVQETETNIQPGFLMYLPVYRSNQAHGTQEERRANLLGWVYSPFRAYDLMAGIRGPQYADLHLKIFDGEQPQDEKLLYATPESSVLPVEPRFIGIRLLHVAGHSWTLDVSPSPEFARELGNLQPPLAPIVGMLASLLVALATHTLLRGRARAEAWIRAIYTGSQLGIVRTNPEGIILDANPAFTRLLGYDLSELVGNDVTQFASRECVSGMLERRHLLKHPGRIHIQAEVRWLRKDGSGVWTAVNVQPVSEPTGGPVFYFGLIQDITARKASEAQLATKQAQLEELNRSLADRVQTSVAELRSKDQLLITQNRQAAMGEMIGNIAHQWRQPLNALGLVLSNLRDASRFGELTAATVEQAAHDGNRLIQKMSSTINDFRDFFRPQKEKSAFSALQQVRETVALVEASFHHTGITITIEAAQDLMLLGFANEYSQVLLNLLTNAKQAIAANQSTDGQVLLRLTLHNGFGCLSVRDTGGGIPEAIFQRLFEPYFSTKEGGIGVGLYMSRQIVERSMGGRLEVRNVEGGAEFSVLTPLLSRP